MTDAERERRIAEVHERFLASTCAAGKRYWDRQRRLLINGRSQAQIERMERARGLARVNS